MGEKKEEENMTRRDCLPISSIPGILFAAFSPLMREILLLMTQHMFV